MAESSPNQHYTLSHWLFFTLFSLAVLSLGEPKAVNQSGQSVRLWVLSDYGNAAF